MQRIRKYLTSAFVATAAGSLAFGAVLAPDTDSLVRERLMVERYDAQEIAVPTEVVPEFTTTVTVDGERYDLQLRHHSMRSPQFRMLVQGEDGVIREATPEAAKTYRGTIRGIPGSRVAASISRGQLHASILLPDGSIRTVQPLGSIVEGGAGPALHVAYPDAYVVDADWGCGADDHDFRREALAGGFEADGADGTGLKVAEIAFDADFEFLIANGFNEQWTIDDIENIANSVEFIYERDVDIAYEVTDILVRLSEPDPYDSRDAGVLLNEFSTHWNGTHLFRFRDVAHLMTGKEINGGTIGIASLGVMCIQASAYGLSQSKFSFNFDFRVALTAHELGHNWSAFHCDGLPSCRIMCSGLGGCTGIVTSFGPDSINSISNYRDSSSCLDDLADPLSLPFFDDFEGGTLDTALWSYNEGTDLNGDAANEPSGSESLHFESLTVFETTNEEVRTNFIQLAGESDVVVSYFTEHIGVESGEEFVVRYWSDELRWEELDRITSDGVDQDRFEVHAHVLPADAFHDEFRLGFEGLGDAGDDDWYLDDVEVVAGASLALTQTTIQRLETATFTVAGAEVGEEVVFLRSLTGKGSGPCPPQVGGLCLDILSPAGVLGTAIADGDGVATLDLNVPLGAPIADVATQAVIVRGVGGADSVKSNAILVPILPEP